MPMHVYIFMPSREMWPASSIDARFPPVKIGESKPMPASKWLDKNRPVEQMTWAPGEPMLIRDRLVANGGWIEHGGRNASTYTFLRFPNRAARQTKPAVGSITSARSFQATQSISLSG